MQWYNIIIIIYIYYYHYYYCCYYYHYYYVGGILYPYSPGGIFYRQILYRMVYMYMYGIIYNAIFPMEWNCIF